jgi:hypothetical protein
MLPVTSAGSRTIRTPGFGVITQMLGRITAANVPAGSEV